MRKQLTLKDKIKCSGLGAHTGSMVNISMLPAEDGIGIVFIRDDIDSDINCIQADHRNTISSPLCTKLVNSFGTEVHTVEHLLAAFSAFSIDNAYVHLDGPEIPIFDGSAIEIIKLIRSVGIKKQKSRKKILKINREVSCFIGEKSVRFIPFDDFLNIKIVCDFSEKGLFASEYNYVHSLENFESEIASARTFGFWEDAEILKKGGLAKGASLDNAIIFKNGECINPSGLRFGDEYIRHKVLDVIGDLSIIGHQIIGKFEGFCPGHAINGALVKSLFSNTDNYEIYEIIEDATDLCMKNDRPMIFGNCVANISDNI